MMSLSKSSGAFAALLASALLATSAHAHQPFFEDVDATASAPYRIRDATVSLALYFTLADAGDVDFFTFDGKKGQRIPIGIVIPQIEGQENFAPMLALIGPGLSATAAVTGALPAGVTLPRGSGALLLKPPAQAGTFYEPFSGDSYWRRQDERVTLPADGRYTIAVWHPQGEAGRYTLSTGSKEIFGGDPQFLAKKRAYWTPVRP